MDVHCSTCNEPWDAYHLRHEAIFETPLSHDEAEAWTRLPTSQQLTEHYRQKFKAAGYEFGGSILNVRHCPCCPKGARLDLEKEFVKEALVEMLGNDEDAIASTLEELGL